LTQRLARESASFLSQVSRTNDPFFLYLSFYSVHTPLQAPTRLIKKYENKAKKLGISDPSGSIEKDGERQVWPETEEPRSVRVRQDHAVYAAMVESLDHGVGLVLRRLEELGLRDNTAVVFMSDNGGLSTSEGLPTSNLPFRGGKGWMYEGGIREPMVIRWPGVTAAGTRCSVPAVSTDFYPTFLDMAGLPKLPDQHLDGVSLVPLLRNPFAKFERGPIFFHYPHYSNQGGFPASAVREGDFKLIQDLEDGAYELYNLHSDPEEHNNLEQFEAEKTEALAKSLNEWRSEVDARPLRKHSETGAMPPALW
ncbi:MAG: sulfatase-like hydrolase/transferase, partial [Verrucomicrobiota bacterium]